MTFTNEMMTNAIASMYRQNEKLCTLITTIYETMTLTRKIAIHAQLRNAIESLPQGSTIEDMRNAEIDVDKDNVDFVVKSNAALEDLWKATSSKNEILLMAVLHGWMSMVKSYQDVLPFLKPFNDLQMFGE